MQIVKVSNLRKEYGKGEAKVVALDSVNLVIEKGEFVAITGASGSGKSTLMHLIGGVDRPTDGKVFIDGTEVYSLNEEKLAIFRRRQGGIIYQFYNLIPVLTAKENILLPIELDNSKVDQEYLKTIVDILGLEDRLDYLPNQLSGGQQQRVSVGRAMINHPSIILADEPTGNLDSENSKEIMDLLIKANREFNQTILMITHDERLALQASRVIRMKDGQIISDERLRR